MENVKDYITTLKLNYKNIPIEERLELVYEQYNWAMNLLFQILSTDTGKIIGTDIPEERKEVAKNVNVNYISAQEELISKMPLQEQVAKWKEKYNYAMNVCRKLIYDKLTGPEEQEVCLEFHMASEEQEDRSLERFTKLVKKIKENKI